MKNGTDKLIDALSDGPIDAPTCKKTVGGNEIHIPYAKGTLVLYQLSGSEHLFTGKFIFNRGKK